jgi:hypothetical protein
MIEISFKNSSAAIYLSNLIEVRIMTEISFKNSSPTIYLSTIFYRDDNND